MSNSLIISKKKRNRILYDTLCPIFENEIQSCNDLWHLKIGKLGGFEPTNILTPHLINQGLKHPTTRK